MAQRQQETSIYLRGRHAEILYTTTVACNKMNKLWLLCRRAFVNKLSWKMSFLALNLYFNLCK